jgi:drug/metabolite transporter (DMT)-like permease
MIAIATANNSRSTGYRYGLLVGFLAIYLIWGSTYLAIAVSIETIPPLLMTGVRSVIAGAVLYVFARARGAPAPQPKHWRGALLTGGLFFLVSLGLLAWAQQRVASGQAALLVATSPLWVMLLGWLVWQVERPGGRALAAALIGLAGVGTLVGSAPGGEGADMLGTAAVLASAGAWALGLQLVRRVSLPTSLPLATAIQLLAGGGLLLLASVAAGEPATFDVSAVSLRSLAGMSYLIVFGSIVAFSAYIWLLRVSNPVGVSTHAFVNPLVAVLLGWAFNGEALTLHMALAAGLIIVSVILVVLRVPPRPPRIRLRGRASARVSRGLPSPVRVSAGPRRVHRDRAGS